MRKQIVTLKFNPNHYQGIDVRDGLSAVIKIGDYLWLACDESANIERLYFKTPELCAEHEFFPLAKYLDLPEIDGEIDIEGLDFQGNYLWIIGSHSLKRKKARPEKENQEKEIQRLTKIEKQANRYLLARIPVVKNPDTGICELAKVCPNPDHPQRMLYAGMVQMTSKGNELFDLLQKDEHLQGFFDIPCKENGFDIEGLAVYNDRVFIGLRGPVLRGWAVILEIEIELDSESRLKIRKNAESKYRKHFIHLDGLGIRELCVHKQDLLILAGPTMDISGNVAVYRWKNAFTHNENELVKPTDVQRITDIPTGFGNDLGKDKAEGITLLNQDEILIVYDSPSEIRKTMLSEVMADVFAI